MAGVCSLVLTVGLARFAYTPLLPRMMADAGLTVSGAGWLASVNYLGYIAGALVGLSIQSHSLRMGCYRAGLFIAFLSTFGMGLTEDWGVWAVLRFIAGLSSATGMLLGSGIVLNWLIREGQRTELGIHFTGMGLGIAVSGLIVWLTADSLDWADQWLVLGLAGVAVLIPAWAWMPNLQNQPTLPSSTLDKPKLGGALRILGVMYFCAGYGYVVSATFLVSYIDHQPGLRGEGAKMWIIVGLAAMAGSLVWDRVARTLRLIPALNTAYGAQLLSVPILIFSTNQFMAHASAILFGASFIGVVSLTLTLVGRLLPAASTAAMSRLTLSYGVAQIVAPLITGYSAARSNGYMSALLVVIAVMLIGFICLVLLAYATKINDKFASDEI